jgi:pyruvate carboxylase
LSGELGDPPGGWPEPFRTKALEGRESKARVTELDDDQSQALASDDAATRRRTLNRLLFPGPTDDYESSRIEHGDLSALPTDAFLYGLRPDEETEVELAEGTLHLFGVEAIGEPDERGMRNVLGTINGQLRPTEVRDRSVDAKVASAEKADTTDPKQVAVPFAGVVSPLVEEGDSVESGQAVATIEAMKMEASITAPSAGTVKRLAIPGTRQAEGGDLLLVLE